MRKVLMFITLAAICGGSVPVFAKIALEVLQPFTLVMIRFFLASILLVPFVKKMGELNYSTFKQLFWVAMIGSLNPILLFIALPFTKASVSPLIYAAVPALTAIYLKFSKNQQFSFKQILGIIIGFIGVGTIVILPLLEKGNYDANAFNGNILIFLAAIAFMFYGIISKNKQQILNISPLSLTFYFCLITFILSIPFSINEISNSPVIFGDIELKHVLASLGVGIIGTSVFYLAYQYAIKLSSEVTAGLFTYLQPVATILMAAMILGEIITVPFIIGGIMAVIGAQIASGRDIFSILKIRKK